MLDSVCSSLNNVAGSLLDMNLSGEVQGGWRKSYLPVLTFLNLGGGSNFTSLGMEAC